MSAPVFADLVGQEIVIQQLEQAINTPSNSSGHEITHAWLFTGPPILNVVSLVPSGLILTKALLAEPLYDENAPAVKILLSG